MTGPIPDISVALLHANNQPRMLLQDLNSGKPLDLSTLDQNGCGTIGDFRAAAETGQLRVEKTSSGTVFYHLSGSGGFSGDAATLVASVMDISPAQARAWLIDRAQEVQEVNAAYPQIVEFGQAEAYLIQDGRLVYRSTRQNRKTGEPEQQLVVIAEFSAYIVETLTYITCNQISHEQSLVIAGFGRDGQPLSPPKITVPANEFRSMHWLTEHWATQAIVLARAGAHDHLRAAIELLSQKRSITRRTIYRNTGWILHPEHGRIYLTNGAVIGKNGVVDDVEVALPAKSLSHYALPPVPEQAALQDAVRQSLNLVDVAKEQFAIPYLLTVYRAPLGHLDAFFWPTGKTNRQKTALMAIMMRHFGTGWHERNPPLGWSSSANGIEMVGSYLRDVLANVEDYKPDAKSHSLASAELSRIIRAVGDGVGRYTLTKDRELRSMPELCAVFASTSETYPSGHSDLARTIVLNVTEAIAYDQATSDAMYAAVATGQAGIYSAAMAGYIRFIAQHFDRVYGQGDHHAAHMRDYTPLFPAAHGRTSAAMAELAYGMRIFLCFATKLGAITTEHASQVWQRTCQVLSHLAAAQGADQVDEDPIIRFLLLLNSVFSQNRVSLEPLVTSGEAALPDWLTPTQHTVGNADRRVMLGWFSKRGNSLWIHFIPDAVYELLQETARRQNAPLPPKKTLWARLRDDLHPLDLMLCDREGTRVRWEHSITVTGQKTRALSLRWPLQESIERLNASATVKAAMPQFPPIDWLNDL